MIISVLCIGKVKDKSLQTLAAEYEKRISRFQRLKIIEIKDSNQKTESKKIIEYIQKNKEQKYILLDERGKIYNSTSFSNKLKTHEEHSEEITFILSGANGPIDEVKNLVKDKLALSTMTFTHEMARILLLEQIYRVITMWNNIPYHKD